MVSTYEDRSIPELIAVKDRLLSAIGGACDEVAERLAAHLDAVQLQLDRRVVPMERRERTEVDEDGEIVMSVSMHCPNCEARCRPSTSFCHRCGQCVRVAA